MAQGCQSRGGRCMPLRSEVSTGYTPWNRHNPWKWLVGRLLSFVFRPRFRVCVSFRECSCFLFLLLRLRGYTSCLFHEKVASWWGWRCDSPVKKHSEWAKRQMFSWQILTSWRLLARRTSGQSHYPELQLINQKQDITWIKTMDAPKGPKLNQDESTLLLVFFLGWEYIIFWHTHSHPDCGRCRRLRLRFSRDLSSSDLYNHTWIPTRTSTTLDFKMTS